MIVKLGLLKVIEREMDKCQMFWRHTGLIEKKFTRKKDFILTKLYQVEILNENGELFELGSSNKKKVRVFCEWNNGGSTMSVYIGEGEPNENYLLFIAEWVFAPYDGLVTTLKVNYDCFDTHFAYEPVERLVKDTIFNASHIVLPVVFFNCKIDPVTIKTPVNLDSLPEDKFKAYGFTFYSN